MLSCKDITENANQYLDRELPFFTRMKVKMHLAMCKHCQRYVDQLHTTIQALGKLKPQESIDDATVEQIIKNMRKHNE